MLTALISLYQNQMILGSAAGASVGMRKMDGPRVVVRDPESRDELPYDG